MTLAAAPVIERRLNSPGPIADAFLRSRAFLAIIIGPVGSGKTLTALRKLRRVGQRQGGRVDEQGRTWRKARVGVIRESYPQIDKNILPSWFRIHAESDGKFNRRAPYSHQLRLIQDEFEDGGAKDIVDLDVEFRAIGDQSVEEACRGWEVNAVMIDEADLQPPALIAYLSGRVGRFSDLDPELIVDPQIICSLNAPYIDNHMYKLAVEKQLGELLDPAVTEALGGRPLVETFIQPGGRSANAENLHNLPGATKENPKGGRNYYLIQAALNKGTPGYVDRMIDNKFVPMQHGQPVYGDFTYEDHVAKEPIEWDRRRKVVVGIDGGLFAAAVFTQRTMMGQLRTLDEVVLAREDGKALRKVGPTAFGQAVRQKLLERFPGIRPDQVRFVGDPAMFVASDREDNELDWKRSFERGLNGKAKGGDDDGETFRFRVHKAKSNREALRLEAIRNAQAERGGYQVDPRCTQLIRGHLGGYHYKKPDMAEGETRGHLEIADTDSTHPCDAEQYAALEGEHVISEIRGIGRRGRREIVNDSDYAELGGIGR